MTIINSFAQDSKIAGSLKIFNPRRIPLRLVLIVPFVALITGAVSLVGYLSYQSGQEAVTNLADQLMDQASSRVSDHLDTSVKVQQQILTFGHRAFQQGSLQTKDSPQLRSYLWQQVNLSSINIVFGNEQGEFISYGRLLSQEIVDKANKITSENLNIGSIILGEVMATQPNQRNHFLVDDQGKARKKIFTITIDTQTTDWYLAAKNAQSQTWSPVYVFKSMPLLGISAVVPIYDSNKQLQGVLASTFSLSEISTFLDKLKFSPKGQIFIMERDGNLVATSTLELSYLQQDKEKPRRLLATQSQDPQTRAIATHLQQKYGSLNKINDSQRFQVAVSGTNIFARVEPYRDEYGLDWLLITAIPESDFMGDIQSNTYRTFWLCSMTLLVAIGMGIFNARWISKPINQLSRSSQAIAQGNWQSSTPINIEIEEPIPQNHPILEIEILTDSVNQMLLQLQDSHRQITKDLHYKELENQGILSLLPDLMFVNTIEGLYVKQLETSYPESINTLKINLSSQSIWDILPTELAQIRLDHINQAVRTGEIQTYEQQIKIGEILLDEEVRIIKINDQEVLTLIRNINDRKLVERESTKAKEAAEAANLSKSIFLANMSHELRTPLNAIMGFSQLMQRTPGLPEEHYKNAKIIYRSGNYLLALINNILDLSKIEANKTTLNIQEFNLNNLLYDIEEMMKLRSRKAGLSLFFENSLEVPPYICTDEIKLKQVLINLLTNAIKFTQKGEIILRVNCSPSSNSQQTVREEKSKDLYRITLYFSIQDTGVGIAPEELPKIFEAFNQAEAGREIQEGTGLGLTISRQFVQLMGGEMTVTSELGKGTTFQFQIPVQKGLELVQPKIEHQRILALAPGQTQYKILVVDDIEVNRLLLVNILSPLGFQVQEAKNGQEAIDLWESWQPHLIWMDLRMPVMDGYTATKYIKAQGGNTIILALTANVRQDDRTLVLNAGCDDFYTKPFDEQTIFDALSKYLGVSYIYAEKPVVNLDIEGVLTTKDFAFMPPQWLEKLYNACTIGDFDLLGQLIREIPSTASSFAKSLEKLTDEFQSETIIEIIQPLIDNRPPK